MKVLRPASWRSAGLDVLGRFPMANVYTLPIAAVGFVEGSRRSSDARERAIARVAKAAFDAFGR